MYVIKNGSDYLLSDTYADGACCEVLSPVIVIDGIEKKGTLEKSNNQMQLSNIDGIRVMDTIDNIGSGIFKITRSIKNERSDKVNFKSVFEAKTVFKPCHFVFPGFNYDTAHCGGIDAGEIISGKMGNTETNVINTPTGLSMDGSPWVYAYDRTSIPSGSISENDKCVFAIFASDENRQSLESAGSIIRNSDGTMTHRIFHPVSEMPYTYAQKNSFEPPLERYLSLNSNEFTEVSMYMFIGVPRYKYYGTAAVMEACTKIFPFTRKNELSKKEVWDLGISYMRFLIKDAEGVPMFAGRISDKLLSQMHAATLKGEAMAQALKDPENRKLTTFGTGFEIGWAGQGAMMARLFAENGFEKGYDADVLTAEKCLDAYVATQRESGLLFPLYGQIMRKTPDDECRCPDACNIGWAMCELMRSYKLFKEHGKIKQNYYDFAVRIADFAVNAFNPEYGFAKSWKIDGTPVSTTGSIGGFMIMGLCEVYSQTKQQKYLDIAIKAMDFYYERDLDNFICTAGAIDCACIDKETSYPFLESALFLYEETGEKIWIERAEKAAYYFFSWMMFYDCIYDNSTDFVKFGYHTTGGTLISAEHNAIDPWGALLVGAMFRLWHITENENYKIWAKMTWWNALLAITTEKTPEIHGNKRPLGSQNEGFFHCRWTKYRPTCEERGHFNDNLHSWMGAWRLHTLSTMSEDDIDILWE
ncbi:MAG: hypothetical protein J6N52_00995 [Clostridia bacterium]|nr:hypothetical protein [Clostridia bacterium]